jgi:imidazolonepropionase-like amidohydrolase
MLNGSRQPRQLPYSLSMTAWTFSGEFLDGLQRDEISIGSGDPQTLPGRFALAGLVDSHAHPSVTADDGEPFLADRRYAENKLDEYAARGVTLIRDAGGLSTVTLDFARSPMPARPLVTAAGRYLSTADRYFPKMYVPTSPDQLLDAIRDEVAAGAQWVKIIGDFPHWGEAGPVRDSLAMTYDVDTLRQAVQTAHSLGARLALHSMLPAADLVAIGVDSFEHGHALSREDVEALGARAGAWTPTLSATMFHRDHPDPVVRDRVSALSERLRDVLPHAVAHGVRVLAGTDVYGTIDQEIRLLAEFGLTVEQAIAAAGSVARDYLGIAPEGDLVTYDTDPRSNPEVLASPAAVVIRGVRVK